MSFLFEIDAKEHFIARALGRARDELRRAFLEEKADRGFTQAALARLIGVDRSVINRQLTGESNLTMKSVAELAWALNRDFTISLSKQSEQIGANDYTITTTSGSTIKQPAQQGAQFKVLASAD